MYHTFCVAAITSTLWISAVVPNAIASPVDLSETVEIGGAVNTTSGEVQGQVSNLRPNVSEYLGIPFAEPPIGDLRFKAPVPIQVSNETLNATDYVSTVQCDRPPPYLISANHMSLEPVSVLRSSFSNIQLIQFNYQRLSMQSHSNPSSIYCWSSRRENPSGSISRGQAIGRRLSYSQYLDKAGFRRR